jgi:hypothetical protein
VAGLADTAAGLFQPRFLRNALLPVFLFPLAAATPVLLQEGRLGEWARAWNGQSGALKALELALYLAATWFAATILESQLRNLTQLFEGYWFQHLGRVSRAAIAWHRQRRDALDDADDQLERHRAYALAPETALLPTRLGNILRSAEHYSIDRYNADLFLLWPRLYRAFPDAFARNLEEARARMEFLLVVSAWSGAFGICTLISLISINAPAWLTAACFVTGMGLAYVTYTTALPAAEEYGDRLRAGFDLYRFDVLRQLRLKDPTCLEDEQDVWGALQYVIVYGQPPKREAELMYQSEASPEILIRLRVDRGAASKSPQPD